MALIKFGALITKMSGKIGGQSLGTGPAGSYIKNTGTPRKSITLKQLGKMSLMSTTAQRWRSLSQLERDTFNAASSDYTYLNRVGETKNYSGFAIFGQLVNNVANSYNDVLSPPLPVPLPRFSFTPLSTAYVTDGPNDMTFFGSDGQENVEYRIFLSKVNSRGVSNGYRNKFFIRAATKGEEDYVEMNLSTPYIALFGSIPQDGKVFWRCDAVHLPTGQSLKSLHSGSHWF